MMASRKQPIFTLAAIFLTVALVGATCANAQAVRGLQVDVNNQGAAVNQNVTGPLADLIRAVNVRVSGTSIGTLNTGAALGSSGDSPSLFTIALSSQNNQQMSQVDASNPEVERLIEGLVALVQELTDYLVGRVNAQVKINLNTASETVGAATDVVNGVIASRPANS